MNAIPDIVRVASIYDRDSSDCWVVHHPDPHAPPETFAVYNSKTAQFKLDLKGKPKRFRLLDTAGHIALVDSAMLREAPLSHRLKYGKF